MNSVLVNTVAFPPTAICGGTFVTVTDTFTILVCNPSNTSKRTPGGAGSAGYVVVAVGEVVRAVSHTPSPLKSHRNWSVLPSGSLLPLALNVTGLPSATTYGPPGLAVGGALKADVAHTT